MSWEETFYFKGKTLYYNRINFNDLGERTVEIPIAFDFLANLHPESRIMEVGNVLSHYENSLSEYLGLRKRRIADKFEVKIGVDNMDLRMTNSRQKWIASKSTKLNDIEFNWPSPCANAIAVIELTK